MGSLIVITIMIVISGIYRYYHKDNSDEWSPVTETASDNNQGEVANMEEKISTRQLALNIIEQIGSKPEYTEDGVIQFEYQGVTFLMEAARDCKFVNVIWPWCYSFSKFDIDEFARVRQVLNDINARGVVSVFYSIADSDDVAIHIKKHFLLVKQIPELEEYFRLILDCLFKTARAVDVGIEKVKIQECE